MFEGIPHKVKVRNIRYFLFALIVAFSDILGNGNLNLLYFWGVWIVLCMMSKKAYWKNTLLLFLPFLILPISFLLAHQGMLSIEKALFYTIKIFICISIFTYFKINYKRIDITSVIHYLSIIFGILLFVSIITFGNELLWRSNDSFNDFSKVRLEFFYSEPSVLGLISGLMIVLIFHQIMTKNAVKTWLFPAFIFGCTLVLTFSISAMGYVVLAIAVYFLSNLNLKRIKKVKPFILVLIIVGLLGIASVLFTNNAISRRIMAIIGGQDGSFNFRYTAAYNSLLKILENTNGWGLGLGNMNTVVGLQHLLTTGIDYKFANSFMYFVAENGFLGLVYILLLLFMCFKGVLISKKGNNEFFKLKMMLFVFVFVSQIAGGYFTDPTLWCVYGIICSN